MLIIGVLSWAKRRKIIKAVRVIDKIGLFLLYNFYRYPLRLL